MPNHRQRDFRVGSPRHCNKQGPAACRSDANHSLILNGLDAEAESGEEIDADCCTSARTHAGTCRYVISAVRLRHSYVVILVAFEGKGRCFLQLEMVCAIGLLGLERQLADTLADFSHDVIVIDVLRGLKATEQEIGLYTALGLEIDSANVQLKYGLRAMEISRYNFHMHSFWTSVFQKGH